MHHFTRRHHWNHTHQAHDSRILVTVVVVATLVGFIEARCEVQPVNMVAIRHDQHMHSSAVRVIIIIIPKQESIFHSRYQAWLRAWLQTHDE